jgi:hypothetical protein
MDVGQEEGTYPLRFDTHVLRSRGTAPAGLLLPRTGRPGQAVGAGRRAYVSMVVTAGIQACAHDRTVTPVQ